MIRLRLALLSLALPAALAAQAPRPMPRVPPPTGYRVFIMNDMEGMASVVAVQEVIAGNEGERYRTLTSPDYWDHFRHLYTLEANAAIAGARRGGARSFVLNEGHGGNLFANILPWELDTAAILIRGWPKPLVMVTGLDSTAGVVLFIGAHANAGSPGVLTHNFAFDSFTVNGRVLNETGINALIAGEFGVPLALVTGDDVTCREAHEQLGPNVITVITKYALGRTAAITFSPAVVRQMIRDSAALAVQRAMRGEFHPFTLEKPYRVEFMLRRSFPVEYVQGVDALTARYRLEKTGERSWRMITTDAREMGALLDDIERVVLR